jgi:hypothetical protein
MKKTVWAIVWSGKIEFADVFRFTSCHCDNETEALAIYESKREAEKAIEEFASNPDIYKVVKLSIIPA